MIFENSIAWSKSTIGIKCKICRRKNKEEYIVVCDQCSQGYHFECLRGYSMDTTKNSINDLWYCPACRPQSRSRRRYDKPEEKKSKIDYYDADIYDMDVDTTSNLSSHLSDLHSEQSQNNNNNHNQDEIDQSNEDNLCSICAVETGDDNELIQCTQCQSFFHCQCHEPPLRCPPRSTTWACNSCRNGINNQTKRVQTRRQLAIRKRDDRLRVQTQRLNGTRRSKKKNLMIYLMISFLFLAVRKNYREIDEDEDEESDYEQEMRNKRRPKRVRQLSPESTNDTMDKSEENYEIRPTRRRVRIASSSSSSTTEASDEEEILANLNDDDESDIEQDEIEDDVEEEQEENGPIQDTSPSSQ
jgi:hypothetical protein